MTTCLPDVDFLGLLKTVRFKNPNKICISTGFAILSSTEKITIWFKCLFPLDATYKQNIYLLRRENFYVIVSNCELLEQCCIDIFPWWSAMFCSVGRKGQLHSEKT